MFGIRGMIGDRLTRHGGGDCSGGDCSAALLADCYEGPRGCGSRGGCEPEGFCYSATPRSQAYYSGRDTYFGGEQASGFASGFGGGCGGRRVGGLLGGLFGGGGGFFRGMLGGMLGGGLFRGLIGRIFSRFGGGGGGGGGGGFDDGGCDGGGCDVDGGGGDGFEDEPRDDRRDDKYDRRRREDFEAERERNRDRQKEKDREDADRSRTDRNQTNRDSKAESVVDRVKGVSETDKDRSKSMTTFEEESLRLINNYRQKNGLSPVEFDPRLQLIALVHSKYQNANGLGHNENRPGWETPGQRMRQVGLKGWAENSAHGTINTPRQLVQMWIDSPGHRRALLDPNVRIAGISKYGQGATLDMV